MKVFKTLTKPFRSQDKPFKQPKEEKVYTGKQDLMVSSGGLVMGRMDFLREIKER